ncbi:hypothetical protein B296_00058561 [Ensete ventricosum]|uniref:Uncharacterized protein n=1 Tax=Ensete ventricosum TaxID=4639 RepID=A0A426WYY8_ENSVE|nr:hypothetical protein B296_00058561 [Ensete ventricosum]
MLCRQQIKRVQKHVEALDAIKIKNATPRAKDQPRPPQHPVQPQQRWESQQTRNPFQQQDHQQLLSQQQSVVVAAATTNWETFDLLTPFSATTTAASTASSTPHARFDWELF